MFACKRLSSSSSSLRRSMLKISIPQAYPFICIQSLYIFFAGKTMLIAYNIVFHNISLIKEA